MATRARRSDIVDKRRFNSMLPVKRTARAWPTRSMSISSGSTARSGLSLIEENPRKVIPLAFRERYNRRRPLRIELDMADVDTLTFKGGNEEFSELIASHAGQHRQPQS